MLNLSVLQELINLSNMGVELALVTILDVKGSAPGEKGQQMIVLEGGGIVGTVGGGILEKQAIDIALECLKNSENKEVFLDLDSKDIGMTCGGNLKIFVQVHKPKPELLIVGGGHVSHALYEVASLLHFNISIMDDRKEFVNEDRFPKAKKLLYGDILDNMDRFNFNMNTYVVIVTRGHSHDEEALEYILDRNIKYKGVIGSKTKVKKMFDSLENKGIDKSKLDSVYSPIGLDISNNTPEEIAISIIAEILAVKNNKTKVSNKKLK